MKKLIVVALALVIACVFVGCGAGALLEGTQWEEIYTEESVTYRDVWSFKKDNVFEFSHNVLNGSDVNDPSFGRWTVNPAENVLEISVESDASKIIDIIGNWYIDMSKKNSLTLERVVPNKDKKNNEITLNRVKDAE